MSIEGKTFEWDNMNIPYYAHPYNDTLSNERCVEIALADLFHTPDCLEVGRVLPHYGFTRHTVVDKTEPGGVLQDIFEFNPGKKFETIISISTLEHIGEDYASPHGDAVEALAKVKSLLAPGGSLLCTFPLGFSKVLDEALADGPLFHFQCCYIHMPDGTWKLSDKLDFTPYPFNGTGAASLFVGVD